LLASLSSIAVSVGGSIFPIDLFPEPLSPVMAGGSDEEVNQMLENAIGVSVSIPAWLLAASALAGAVIGMSFLLLAILTLDKVRTVSNRRSVAVVPREVAVKEEPVPKGEKALLPTKLVKVSAGLGATEKLRPDDDRGGDEPVTITSAYKPVPPVRQPYWYYVSGVSGRFATLWEALSASGVDVTDNKSLDWKKLSADTRARIKRAKVGEEQPVEVEVVASEAEAPQEVTRQRTVRRGKVESPPGTVVKNLGGGSFVTFKKKGK